MHKRLVTIQWGLTWQIHHEKNLGDASIGSAAYKLWAGSTTSQ